MTDTEQTFEPNNTFASGNEEQPSTQDNGAATNSLKRTAPEGQTEREVKVMKLETEFTPNEQPILNEGTSSSVANQSEKEAEESNNQNITENTPSAVATTNNDTNANSSISESNVTGASATTAPENDGNADNESSNSPNHTDNNNNESNTENINGNNNNGNANGPLVGLANGPAPPPGLHLLNESQHQQLLQSYVQASGQDLANLTASSLAQAMVSPIAVPGLTTNLLQQLQGGNVITALPGPPQLPQTTTMTHHPSNVSPISDDAQVAKRPNSRTMSNDERRQRRLLRNRVAAKECRKKKKQHIHDMEQKIVSLEEENARLHKEVEELNAKLALGAMQGSESYRLMKEVEELNAKLGMGHLPPGGALTAAVMAAASAHQQQQQQSQQQQQQQQQQSPSQQQQPSQQQADNNTTQTSPQRLSPAQVSPHQTPIVSPHEAVKELTSGKYIKF
ncbi:hypothetical protein K501DRAFT_224940 [Backusella circina FSU 941]|nr:hypothetical protein K501DRAFT_224940 [Backusella circina FSU 941]